MSGIEGALALAHFRRGDFVVEWWLWMGNAAPYAPVIFSFSPTLAVSLSPAGVRLWVLGNPASSTYAPVQTVWQHWAVVRSGPTVTLFIAGIAVASQAVAGSANLTAPSLVIGGSGAPDGSSPPPGNLPGLISEFRVVLNAALYTGSFAPPTQPFDAIQGTALLLHATSPSQLLIDASPAAALVSASAGVSWNSAAPFTCYPSGSLSFAGIIRVSETLPRTSNTAFKEPPHAGTPDRGPSRVARLDHRVLGQPTERGKLPHLFNWGMLQPSRATLD